MLRLVAREFLVVGMWFAQDVGLYMVSRMFRVVVIWFVCCCQVHMVSGHWSVRWL